jgi:uncharacterized protein YdhG (YjbR/CyaY superfamily)
MATRTMKKPTKMTTKGKTVGAYITAAPKDRRAALAKLRETITTAAPKATEAISYGMAGYKHNGKYVIYFAYWKTHVALYGMGSRILDRFSAELKPYVQSKGTIQLPADKPLPYGLVTKMVRARIAEIEGASETVDEYLAALPKDARVALGKVRKAIKAAAPRATEGISYQVPVFKLDGRPLVGLGAATAHCTFFLMSTSIAMRARLAELKNYKVGGGSIQFPADKPLPATLVTRLVKARIAEVQKAR